MTYIALKYVSLSILIRIKDVERKVTASSEVLQNEAQVNGQPLRG